jgi:hypothetical protein
MKIKTLLSSAGLMTIFLILIASIGYTRCLEGDCQNGKGTFLFPGGSMYIGEWKNGQMDGHGEFISSSGAKYSGQWRDGNLSQYIYTDDESKKSTVTNLEQEDQEIIARELEKRMGEEGFDPSTDLPPSAAGPDSDVKDQNK